MHMGMFGKVPKKGDFLTRQVAPDVLSPWETWLEKSMSGAKHHLGTDWGSIYQMAPVWRFWIGPEVWGEPLAGAWVPSIDRVGRQFPLTVLLSGAAEHHPAPPLSDPNEEWYAVIESGLRYALSDDFDGDVDHWLAQMPYPQGAAVARGEDRRNAFFAYGEQGLEAMFRDVSDHDHQLASLGRSYWWTAGNAYVGPAIIAQDGMPDAAGFAAMLRGFGPPATPQAPPATAEMEATRSANAQPDRRPDQPDRPNRKRETTLPPTDLIGGPDSAAAAAWMAPAEGASAETGGQTAAPRQGGTTLPPTAMPSGSTRPPQPRAWGSDPTDAGAWAAPPEPEPERPGREATLPPSWDIDDLTTEDAASPFAEDGAWKAPLQDSPKSDPASPFADGAALSEGPAPMVYGREDISSPFGDDGSLSEPVLPDEKPKDEVEVEAEVAPEEEMQDDGSLDVFATPEAKKAPEKAEPPETAEDAATTADETIEDAKADTELKEPSDKTGDLDEAAAPGSAVDDALGTPLMPKTAAPLDSDDLDGEDDTELAALGRQQPGQDDLAEAEPDANGEEGDDEIPSDPEAKAIEAEAEDPHQSATDLAAEDAAEDNTPDDRARPDPDTNEPSKDTDDAPPTDAKAAPETSEKDLGEAEHHGDDAEAESNEAAKEAADAPRDLDADSEAATEVENGPDEDHAEGYADAEGEEADKALADGPPDEATDKADEIAEATDSAPDELSVVADDKSEASGSEADLEAAEAEAKDPAGLEDAEDLAKTGAETLDETVKSGLGKLGLGDQRPKPTEAEDEERQRKRGFGGFFSRRRRD